MFSGMTKLLVGLGVAGSGSEMPNTIEIIDLKSTLTTCKNLAIFPLELLGSIGGLGFQDKPLICGGRHANWSGSNKCFSLKGNEWIEASSLNTETFYAAVSPSPYPSNDQKLFVTGGRNTNTVKVLTDQGWKTLPQSLPAKVTGHCSVLVNSTTVMVIGGSQNNSISSKTYSFNTETEIWTAGKVASL
jgi:hypothetical protein